MIIFMHPPGLKAEGNFIGLVEAMVQEDGMCFLVVDWRSYRSLGCETSRLCSAKPMMSVLMLFMLSRIRLSRSSFRLGLIPLTFV